jgi:hypothetical protein
MEAGGCRMEIGEHAESYSYDEPMTLARHTDLEILALVFKKLCMML